MAKSCLLFASLLIATLALAAVPVFAHAAGFNETKKLIDSNVACDELTDEQLEEIGEYYMEQMHPGEAHEFMHQRMGLAEGSETEEKFHINLAKTMYCGELSTGMTGMGMGGMMGASSSLWSFNSALFSVLLILSIIALVLLIIWLYKAIKRRK
ncbi:hypothetical protein HYV83_01415 [Candidatus Woesearchaeota archaeon]|nr:hypothetical protein [Candidatus Woesearchaeota archaeon]